MTDIEHAAAAADLILTGLVRLEGSRPEAIERAQELADAWLEEARDDDNEPDIAMHVALVEWLRAKHEESRETYRRAI
jgi:hypothetical protein